MCTSKKVFDIRRAFMVVKAEGSDSYNVNSFDRKALRGLQSYNAVFGEGLLVCVHCSPEKVSQKIFVGDADLKLIRKLEFVITGIDQGLLKEEAFEICRILETRNRMKRSEGVLI